MAKVNIVRWDDAEILQQLLSEADTAMLNHIDITGSSGNLTLGSGSADEVILGFSTNSIIISGTTLFKANSQHEDDVLAIFGTDSDANIVYDNTLAQLLISGSEAAPVHVFGAIFSASFGAKITGTLDVPGETRFLIDGTALTTTQFTAPNIDTLLDSSNADALHTHTAPAATVLASGNIINSDFVTTFSTLTEISGTEIVYLVTGENNIVDLADSDAVSTSRIVGVASGSVLQIYESGSTVDVFTMYGDRMDSFTGLTPAAVYYVDTVPGGITTTPSTAGGRTVVQVGIASSATQMVFQPDIVVRGLA